MSSDVVADYSTVAGEVAEIASATGVREAARFAGQCAERALADEAIVAPSARESLRALAGGLAELSEALRDLDRNGFKRLPMSVMEGKAP